MSTSLLDLPAELIEGILVLCDPVDVAQASMACQRLYGVVYGNHGKESTRNGTQPKVFWRDLYLNQPLDDLKRCVNWLGTPRVSLAEGIDWERELQKVIRARSVLSDMKCCKGEDELKEVLTTVLGLVRWVPSISSGTDLAKNLVWVPVTLREFLDLIERGIPSTPSDGSQPQTTWILPPQSNWGKQTKQLHAQLRTLYGLTRFDLTKRRRVESRAWVYDMRKYTRANEYGPLYDRGKRVDWEFLERIHHVMSMHVVWESVKDWVESGIFDSDSEGDPEFEYMIYPMCMPFTQACHYGIQESGEAAKGVVMVEAGPSNEELPENADWAGIEGNWIICFCFCDHRDLISFNESADSETGGLDVSLFEDDGFTEVFMKLEVTLRVTRVANDPDHPGRPIIGFLGVMKLPSTSTMHGIVQLTADNHIKWQFYSGELGGNTIWSSVGIQVGGIGSAYGVLGSWTTVFHDEDDPVGPFWMRKE